MKQWRDQFWSYLGSLALAALVLACFAAIGWIVTTAALTVVEQVRVEGSLAYPRWD